MMLARLLDEQLDPVEQSSIADHVESCVCCQERLKELTSAYSRLSGLDELNRPTSEPWPTVYHSVLDSRSAGRPSSWLVKMEESPPSRHALESEFPAVDGYTILAELGHGGMGVVYKAYQVRLSRFVALKMIRAGSLAKPEDLARFRIEAEAVAKQRHPNIIQIFDIGEVGGLPFVALELLDGGGLDAFLGGTPQPAEASARLSATLARAIHAAHQAGIIHRDLKPSNVMFGSDGIPKITDFGLAKRLEEEGYTETGQVLGSPSYIPPEQAQGRAKEVGPAADVYALGAILYEMLTGRPPFKGTTPVETVMQVLNEDPVPPSFLQPQVPHDLETICLKCLAKEAHKRYPSALGLAEDLDRYLADRPIQARRRPVLERGLRWARRRPVKTFLLAFCGVLVSCGLVALLRSEADYRVGRVRFQSGLNTAGNEMIDGYFPIEELSRLETSTEKNPRYADLHTRAREMLQKARFGLAAQQSWEKARDRLREFFSLRDAALFQDTQLMGLDPSENVAAVRESTTAALTLFAADGPGARQWTLAPFHALLTEHQREEVARGCYEMLLVRAEAVAQPLSGESATVQARAGLEVLERAALLRREPTHAYHLRRAACLERAGDAEGAIRERKAAELTQPDGAFDHFLTGLEQYKRGYLVQAKRHFAEALGAQANHFWAQCLLAHCDLNDRRGSPEAAKGYLTACLQTHPELPWLYLLRGFASGQLGARALKASRDVKAEDLKASREVEAKENFADALADYREAQSRDSEGRFRYALLANRGLVRFQSQKLDLAVDDLQEAIALNPRQLNAHVTLAQIFLYRHQVDLALEELGRAIALHPNLAPLYRTRAHWNLERTPVTPQIRALALADLDLAVKLGVPDSPDQADDHAERGRILLAEKQYQKALDACDLALRIDPKNVEVLRHRVGALLELKRDQDAIDACDAFLRTGHQSADLLGLRGLAKARRDHFAAAIDDYTLALALEPSVAVMHARRGWAYLVTGASQLALRDFEEAIRLDPSSGDAYGGRGSALVALGRCREAVADAEESLRRGQSEARSYYSAARILTLAAESARKETRQRDPSEPARAPIYQARALTLLDQAIARIPAGERATFWRAVVQPDQAFAAIRRLPAFTRLAAVACRPQAE
jgi:eukaryotic-like serine/threonine-protein kinase